MDFYVDLRNHNRVGRGVFENHTAVSDWNVGRCS